MRSNQRRNKPDRSFAVRAAQAGRARAAAAIARRVSAVPMFGMRPKTSAVAGLCTTTVPPLSADSQRPSMKHCCRNSRGSLNFIRVPRLADVSMQKFQGALEGEICALRLVACAVAAVESMFRRIKIIDALRVGGFDLRDRG